VVFTQGLGSRIPGWANLDVEMQGSFDSATRFASVSRGFAQDDNGGDWIFEQQVPRLRIPICKRIGVLRSE